MILKGNEYEKIVSFVVLFLLIMGSGVSNVYANEEDGGSTRGPVCEFTSYYVPTSTSNQLKIADQGTFVNNTSVVQSKSFVYSTTISASISTGISAEFSMITAKLEVSSLATVGSSSTVTKSTTLYFPANKTTSYKLGHMDKVTSGRIETINNSCGVTSKSVNAKYTYQYYDVVG